MWPDRSDALVVLGSMLLVIALGAFDWRVSIGVVGVLLLGLGIAIAAREVA